MRGKSLWGHWSEKSQVRQVNRVIFSIFWTYVLESTRMIVEPTRSWHAQECSEHTSTRADPRVQEPTRPERPICDRPHEPTRIPASRLGQKSSKCAQEGEPTPIARSRPEASTEPTRTTHTDKITASFFSLLQIQIFKRLDFKSQRSVSWKTIIKAVKAPLERYTRKKRKKKRRES